ncbi:uncharacterized protein LOC109830966 [Asparagus officinalis]|uniref:uncharacterized protein LOC109830966 n=1 Tax=Asparagus officinalis TaxID=4686 RepID=UPI00098DF9B1|nr:uncharacterized protein LOC109830966 [Asparagus officinalis]
MKQAPSEVSPKISTNPLYYPYFKDCISMIYGTYIDAMLPASIVARFRGRKGKYYLCDAGYTTMHGLSPYIEECVDIVIACTILHNYIAIQDPGDELLHEDNHIEEDGDEIANEGEEDVVDFTQTMTQREEKDSRNEWRAKRDRIEIKMWEDYCDKYHGGDTIEIRM